MAYARHSDGCEWYIWAVGEPTPPRSIEEERLACWHLSAMEPDQHDNHLYYTYPELKRMLETGDFSSIPGSQSQTEVLVNCIRRFIEETESEWSERRAGWQCRGSPPNKALQLTRRRRAACGGPPAGGRPGGWQERRPPAGVPWCYTGGAQLSARSVGRRGRELSRSAVAAPATPRNATSSRTIQTS
jgi:hypothetical protein